MLPRKQWSAIVAFPVAGLVFFLGRSVSIHFFQSALADSLDVGYMFVGTCSFYTALPLLLLVGFSAATK